jgi:hypothetical protein
MNKSNLILIILLTTGCAGIQRNFSNLLFPPFPSSDQRKNESVKLKINYFKNDFDKNSFSLCQGELLKDFPDGGAGPVAALAAEFAVKQMISFLDEEAKRYTATYSKASVGDRFWDCQVDTSKENSQPNIFVNVKSFTVTRLVNDYVASELVFKVLPSKSKDALLIFPIKAKVNQSKAKVALFDITRPFGFDVLAPWTIFSTIKNNEYKDAWGLLPVRDPKIDLKVDISINSAWLEKEGKWQNQSLTTQSILLPSQNITGNSEKYVNADSIKEVNADDIEMCEESKDFEQAQKYCGSLFNETTFQPPVPRSTIPLFQVKDGKIMRIQDGLGFGTFSIGVLVTEYDSFGEKVTQIKDTAKSNEKSITESLTGILNGI